MSLTTFVMLTLNGITFAAILFIVSSGLTLAFGLLRVVNLAHGAFYMLGGYLGYSVLSATGSVPLALAAAGIALATVGLVVERVLLRRVRGLELSEALMTIAIGIIIADVLLMVYGGEPRSLPLPSAWRAPMDLGIVFYPGFRIYIIAAALLLGAGLWLLLSRSRLGIAIRAGVDDPETARSQGVPVPRLFSGVFALAALLAGVAGVIGSSYMSLGQGVDIRILMLSLVVMIIGGMGSIKGAAVGALITGLVYAFASGFAAQFSLFFLFAPMVLVLAVRPQGLFGRTG